VELSSAGLMSAGSKQGFELGQACRGSDVLPQPFVHLAGKQAALGCLVEQRRERRLVARSHAGYQRRRHEGDACISVAPTLGAAAHACAVQLEIAPWTVGRIGNEHEGREKGGPRRGGETAAKEPPEVVLAVNVRVDKEE